MVANVAKWGNSLAVRIPQYLAQEMQLLAGTEIDMVIVDGNLVIKPRKIPQYSLAELVANITPENCHAEITTGEPQGVEIW